MTSYMYDHPQNFYTHGMKIHESPEGVEYDRDI